MSINKSWLKKGIIIPFLLVFLMSQNTFAVTKDYNSFSLRLRYDTGSGYETSYVGGYGVSYMRIPVKYLDRVGFAVQNITVPPNSNYMAVTAKINLVATTYGHQNFTKLPYNLNDGDIFIDAVAINGNYQQFQNSNVTVYVTDWYCDLYNENIWSACRTFTYEVTYVLRNIPSTINQLGTGIEYTTRLQQDGTYEVGYYFENVDSNRLYADFSNDLNSALLQQQVQQQQLIIESINNLNTTNNNYYEEESESVDNISDQTTSDISNATNSQTTSLINTLTSFVGAITAIDTTGNCQLTLPFPNFAGGSFTVNPCNGADKAPTIIQVFSSLFLIGIFVPLAWLLLKMIYNEIRSWTNG